MIEPLRIPSNPFAAVLLLLGAVCLPAADWPQWRGADNHGHAEAKGLPQVWSAETNVAWRTEIPGRGWSTPVIAGRQIWLTTALETPANPADTERRLKTNTGTQPVTLLEKVELRAVCLDRDSGKLLYEVHLLTEHEPQWVHQLNSYASPTPVLEDGRLYCHFGAFGTACVDTRKARVAWTNTTLRVMHENGPGSTPILWQDLVIFHLDGSDKQFIAALDKRTGEVRWTSDRSGEMRENPQLKKSYGTPVVVQVDGREELISPASDWLYAYDPANGSERWKLSYGTLGFSIAPVPVTGHGMIFMSTGFMRPQMLGIRHDGKTSPEIAWRYTKGAPTMPSPLLVGDELYFLTDAGGILTCLDARTGEEHYRERLGGNFSASPLFADGRIFVSNREGETFVLAPGKQFQLLAKNTLPEGHYASPVALDKSLFLRTEKALYRIEQRNQRAKK
jgi:outer membrane protein assembly factor BamB